MRTVVLLSAAVAMLAAAKARATCPNSVCESGETCSSCPADCGDCNLESYCNDSDDGLAFGTSGDPVAVWTVDDNLATSGNQEALPMGNFPWTTTDVRVLTDMMLANQVNHSRARIAERVLQGSNLHCGSGTLGCIHGDRPTACTQASDCLNPQFDVCHSNGDCGSCASFGSFAGCNSIHSPRNCYATLCVNNAGGLSHAYQVAQTLSHEMGHAITLWHPSPESSTCLTGLTQINTDNDPIWGTQICSSSTDDGCAGETMCHNLSCAAFSPYADGDSRGLRAQYNGASTTYYSPQIAISTASASTMSAPTFDVFAEENWQSIWQPRIDCAKGTVASGGYECVSVRSYFSGGTMFVDIEGLNNSSGWIKTEILTTASGVVMEPDIAISDDGTKAFVVAVSWAGENAWAWGVDLKNKQMSSATSSFQANLPPRIAYDSDLGSAVIVGVQAIKRSVTLGGGYVLPEWIAKKVSYNSSTNTTTVGSLTSTPLTTDPATSLRLPYSDYDFDCRRNTAGADTCVLVATLIPEDDVGSPHHAIGSLRSISFTASSTALSIATTAGGAPDWQERSVISSGLNAVRGVTLSSSYLYVVAGKVLTGGSDVNNTRISQFSSLGVGATESGSAVYEGEPSGCSSHSTNEGWSLSAAAQHGGHSIAWCPNCGSGTLEGLALQPQAGWCW